MEGSQEKIPKPRIGTLSDMIFALALSIGTIGLVSNSTATGDQAIPNITSSILVFGFSFYIIITIWIRYTKVTSVLPIESSGTITLNGMLLFCVAIEPYLLNLLFKAQIGSVLWNFLSSVYALDLAALFALLGFFTHLVTVEERNLIHKSLLREYKLLRNFELVSAGLWLLSVAPIFVQITIGAVPLREWIWLTPIVLANLRRVIAARAKASLS